MASASLPPETIHLPFEDGPFRMAMGLTACPEAAWIELDDRYADEIAERRQLLATHRAEVLAATPEAGPACAEFLALLADHLPRHHPEHFRRQADTLHNRLTGETWDLAQPGVEPLELAGRLVQEDFCLIRPDPEGPILDAAILCAPSRWRLGEKIGRPLLAVHGPVPFYADRLGSAVDRFMRNLRPGRVALRMNWSVVDDPALYQPWGKHRTVADPSFTAANAGQRLHFRTERQTFRRLERSGHVAFGIRVHSYSLARIAAIPGAAAQLAGAVRALPAEMGAYKSLPVFAEPLLAYLDAAAESPILPTA